MLNRKIFKTVALSFGLIVLGVMLGAYLFSGVQPRSFLSIHKCEEHCLSRKELLGLIGSLVVQKVPGVLPSILMETDKTIAFEHPNPAMPIHYMIVPKRDIKDISDISADDQEYLIDAFAVMRALIEEHHLTNYRIVTNGPGVQQVRYLHFHLLAQKPKS